MKLFSKEVRLGISALLSIVIIYFGIMFLKGLSFNRSTNHYFVEMTDVSGLAPQADIMVNGLKVGLVKTLEFDQERQSVIIGIELKEGFRVPVGSTATLTKDMLGAPKMKITLGTDPTRVLAQNDTIKGYPMSDLMASAGDIVPQIELLIPKFDSLLTSVNVLLAAPSVRNSLDNIEMLTAQLNVTARQLDALVGQQAPKLLTNANGVMGNMNNVMANLAQTTDALNQANLPDMVQKADAAMANLQFFTNQLNDSTSSLGRLMNDDSFYSHLDSAANNASMLLYDLRENPKRYVHFSIFGRKDKK